MSSVANNANAQFSSSLSAAMPSDLKYQNRVKILNAFRDGREYTAGDISSATGISKLTVMRAIQFFCSKNVLVLTGKGNSTEVGGKKPDRFKLLVDKTLLCITLWPGTLNFSLYDLLGHKLSYREISLSLPTSIDEVFSVLKEHSDSFFKENKLDRTSLYGVSLSTAGTIDYKTRRLKYSSLNPSWGKDIPVADYLKKIYGKKVEVFIENSGKMAGRSVLLNEAFRDKRVLVLFTTWGVSACLIENGHILNGKDSLIGEIGHMTLDPNDMEVCGCGSRGCFERLISIKRVQEQIKKNPPSSASPLYKVKPKEITLSLLFDAARENDSYAKGIIANLAHLFALALRNICLVYNPDVVIFQGDYSHADGYFDEALKAETAAFRYFPAEGAFETLYDTRSLFELDGLGAARSLSDMFFENPAIYSE